MFAFSSNTDEDDLINATFGAKTCEISIELGPCNVVTTNKSTYTQYSFRFRAGPYVHVFSERYSKLREFNECLLRSNLYQTVFGYEIPPFPKKRWIFDHTKPKQYNKRANELLKWFKIIISEREIVRCSLFQNRIRLPKILKVALWTNKDVLQWIADLNLSKTFKNIMMTGINNNVCIGLDIIEIQNAKDVAAFFNFNNPMLQNRIFREIKKIKGDTDEIEIIKKNSICPAEEVDEFKINLFCQNKQVTLNQRVRKNTKISYIKQLYKYESAVAANVNEFHFYAKLKLLPPNNTLEQCNIFDDKHLITVKFDSKGANTSNWKSKDIEEWTCNELKEWINSLHLKAENDKKIINIISQHNINGRDFNSMEEVIDIMHSFQIDKDCANKIFKEFELIGTNTVSTDNNKKGNNSNRIRNNRGPICICGRYLQKRWIQSVYNGTGVSCDHCFRDLTNTTQEFVYHCPGERNQRHANGYDLCVNCAPYY